MTNSYSSIQSLTPRHYKILDYSIAGLSATDIAQKLSMSRGQVHLVLQSPSFQHQFALRRNIEEEKQSEISAGHIDEVASALKKSAIDAANKLILHLDSADEKISLKSATELLDRTGYPKETKIAGIDNTTNVIVSATELNILKESLELDDVGALEKTETVATD